MTFILGLTFGNKTIQHSSVKMMSDDFILLFIINQY